MIISHKYRFICLNPPKTGTETREEIFSKLSDIDIHKYRSSNLQLWNECPSIRHLNYHQMINFCNLFDIEYKKYFIFTFVRNPWKRIESWYSMKSTKDESWKVNHFSFHKFITTYIHESRWQDTYINKVNYVGSLENIENDMNYVFNFLKIKAEKIIHKNKSSKEKKTNIKNLWTDDLIDLVRQKEKNTMELKQYVDIP